MIDKVRRHARWVILVLVSYWIVLFAGTHAPTLPGGVSWVNDKLAHFAGYAGLAFLLAWATSRSGRRAVAGDLILLAIVAGYGVVDELSQLAVPGRSAELRDWLCDLGGAAAGLLLYRGLHAAIAAACSRNPSGAGPGGKTAMERDGPSPERQ